MISSITHQTFNTNWLVSKPTKDHLGRKLTKLKMRKQGNVPGIRNAWLYSLSPYCLVKSCNPLCPYSVSWLTSKAASLSSLSSHTHSSLAWLWHEDKHKSLSRSGALFGRSPYWFRQRRIEILFGFVFLPEPLAALCINTCRLHWTNLCMISLSTCLSCTPSPLPAYGRT